MATESTILQQIQDSVHSLVQAVSEARIGCTRWIQQREQEHQHRLAELEMQHQRTAVQLAANHESALKRATASGSFGTDLAI